MKRFILIFLLLFVCCCKTQVVTTNEDKVVNSKQLDKYKISNSSFNDSILTGTWYQVINRNYVKVVNDSIIYRAYIDLDSTTITKRVDK